MPSVWRSQNPSPSALNTGCSCSDFFDVSCFCSSFCKLRARASLSSSCSLRARASSLSSSFTFLFVVRSSGLRACRARWALRSRVFAFAGSLAPACSGSVFCRLGDCSSSLLMRMTAAPDWQSATKPRQSSCQQSVSYPPQLHSALPASALERNAGALSETPLILEPRAFEHTRTPMRTRPGARGHAPVPGGWLHSAGRWSDAQEHAVPCRHGGAPVGSQAGPADDIAGAQSTARQRTRRAGKRRRMLAPEWASAQGLCTVLWWRDRRRLRCTSWLMSTPPHTKGRVARRS